MRKLRIAAIPADGIGQEVVGAGLEVLDALATRDGAFEFDLEHFDWGTERYNRKSANRFSAAEVSPVVLVPAQAGTFPGYRPCHHGCPLARA